MLYTKVYRTYTKGTKRHNPKGRGPTKITTPSLNKNTSNPQNHLIDYSHKLKPHNPTWRFQLLYLFGSQHSSDSGDFVLCIVTKLTTPSEKQAYT